MNDGSLPTKPPWADPHPIPSPRDDTPRKSDHCTCWSHRLYAVLCDPPCEAYNRLKRIHTAELGRDNTTMLERLKHE